MNALSVVLIVVAIVGLVVVAMAVQSLIMTLRTLRETVEDLRRETLPAIAELRATVDVASGELERVDSLLDTAEDVSARVDATSKLTWMVLRNPLVKLASVSVASDRVARRRGGDGASADVGGRAIPDGRRDLRGADAVAELPAGPGRGRARRGASASARRRRKAG